MSCYHGEVINLSLAREYLIYLEGVLHLFTEKYLMFLMRKIEKME